VALDSSPQAEGSRPTLDYLSHHCVTYSQYAPMQLTATLNASFPIGDE